MLLYRDVISGDEMISDAYKIEEVDDIFYEVNARSLMGLIDDFNHMFRYSNNLIVYR